jgi:hypothetical protein
MKTRETLGMRTEQNLELGASHRDQRVPSAEAQGRNITGRRTTGSGWPRPYSGRMARRQLPLLVAALAVAGCVQPLPPTAPPSQSTAADIVLVIENRTFSSLFYLPPDIIKPCSQVALTQAAIDAGVQAELDGRAPPPPADAVDLSAIAIAPPSGAARPAVLVVTAEGSSVQFGQVSPTALPPCAGRARPPS